MPNLSLNMPPTDDIDHCVDPNDSHERKKLRNRLSQRAFRRRQAESIRELRSLANINQKPENERNEELQRENSALRTQLVDVQNKLSRLLTTVQGLSDAVAKTLDETAVKLNDNKKQPAQRANTSQANVERTIASSNTSTNWPITDASLPLEGLDAITTTDEAPAPMTISPQDLVLRSSQNLNLTGLSPFSGQIPKIWEFEYQMGPESYLNAMDSTEKTTIILGKRWAPSNSPFSDHLNLLQHLLKAKLDRTGLITSPQSLARSLYQPILMVLSMFNSMARPHMMDWYAKTRYFPTIYLTAWQIHPSMSTYGRLDERFRPTELQASTQHPRVIGWIAFPSIRDRLIQLHAANPYIDQIFCDVVNSYVVEATMSDLILGAPPLKVYVRVTDLIPAMSSLGDGETEEDMALPAPDAVSLFTMGKYARAAFRFLNMDQGPSFYKVEPAFFGKYPELHDDTVDIMASGIPLKLDIQLTLTPPKPLDPLTAETYHSFLEFYLDSLETF
ncbi:hypothetical protein EDB81DRAFT_785629 [Dactylonectria macrodidyma]|uniref:BZIP domain-containing protein n=1 Tax=Dactylonectria macrodidyma TaxID=307937 RepID=A0A9P9JHN6_9HYPO|nr:hypothetical protein EDB81DRAFT_785629 [Dactylonectria macrodidyma]